MKGWHQDYERHSLAGRGIKTVFLAQPSSPRFDKTLRVIDDSEKEKAILSGENNFRTHADYKKFYSNKLKEEFKKENPNRDLINYYSYQLRFHSKFKPIFVMQSLL